MARPDPTGRVAIPLRTPNGTAPSCSTSYDVYGHLLPGSHDEARERMDAYLLGAAEPAERAA